MNFDKELEKRLSSVREAENEQEEKEKGLRLEEELLLETKDIIDSVLRIVSNKFKNSLTNPTHMVEHTGEVVFKFGVGQLCYIDFKKDDFYNFPQPCKIAFHVSVNNYETKEVTIAAAYISAPDALERFDLIKKVLKENPIIIFSDTLDGSSIKQAVEKEILVFLDDARRRNKN